MKKKVLLGLSGGVDSTVSAIKLLEAGYDVTGIFMVNCESGAKEYVNALQAANQIGIKLIRGDFREKFSNKVIKYFIDGYKSGITPHPCVLCNRYFKFQAFMDYIKEENFDYLAMGHYARTEVRDGITYLLKGLDSNKDQTYFLCALSQEQISKSIFPIGEMTKPEVRKFAEEHGMLNAKKHDSLDVCFIENNDFSAYIAKHIPDNPGYMVTPNGQKIKKHKGLHYYTIGQRKGLEIGGIPVFPQKPWFVVGKNVKTNEIIVDQGSDSPYLISHACVVSEPNWISVKPEEGRTYTAKFRYRSRESEVTLSFDGDSVKVSYPTGASAVTLGQACVIYDGDIVLGGGSITEVIK